jgi:hypothetical protein
MNILRLSPTGIDTVVFWSSPESPGGCFVRFDRQTQLFCVASIQRGRDAVHEVGLLIVDDRLYHYLVQELQGRSLRDFDIDFVSDARQIFGLCRPGGFGEAPPAVVEALNPLAKRMSETGIGDEIMQALHRQRF